MIKDNVLRIKERIAASCAKINSDPSGITLLCVTKGRTLGEINGALEAGLSHLGENRVQEAKEKYRQLPSADWQMVGHLQLNKVKDALKIFSLIHSVDSVKLAVEIDKQASRMNKTQDILLEVKTSFEETKYGLAPEALASAVEEILKLGSLKIKGLMTIAPVSGGQIEARRCFSLLRRLRDEIDPSWLLSMGMSDDFETAIEEGADIIRLGRIIFG